MQCPVAYFSIPTEDPVGHIGVTFRARSLMLESLECYGAIEV